MERIGRKPFQGILNIIRFNWHYYVISALLIAVLLISQSYLPDLFRKVFITSALLALLNIFLSLAASFYIYDLSNLYSLDWLNDLAVSKGSQLININAGFDETSGLLLKKYPDSILTVFDFYDAKKHTEISIERARKAYPAFPGTKAILTSAIPLQENSADCIFLILAAHEIRNSEERILFFRQLKNFIRTDGKIIVVEHQRDFMNFLAYTIGFFHFHSNKTWKNTFSSSGLIISSENKLTPFLSIFTLTKNGTAS